MRDLVLDERLIGLRVGRPVVGLDVRVGVRVVVGRGFGLAEGRVDCCLRAAFLLIRLRTWLLLMLVKRLRTDLLRFRNPFDRVYSLSKKIFACIGS